MTTPDKTRLAEDVGSLEIFGTPFSTFTRSITMGLEEMGLGGHYIQHPFTPHSAEVKKRNPLGLLPVLIHRPDAIYTSAENAVVLFESNAVRRYLDDFVYPTVSRHGKNQHALTPPLPGHGTTQDGVLLAQAAEARARVDQWVSMASSTLFQNVEFGVVKPRLAMEKNGADDATVYTALEGNIDKMHAVLAKLEDLAKREPTPFLCGSEITWADLFLYPALADLRATPQVRRECAGHKSVTCALTTSSPPLSTQGDVVRGSDAKFPWIAAWADRMDARPSAKSTYEGTLASQRKK